MFRILARSVLPVSSPAIREGGAVRVDDDGRVLEVGRTRDVAAGDRPDLDLGDVALAPGPINAHTHLELSFVADRRPAGGDWVRWVERLIAIREDADPRASAEAAARAIDRLLARGVVAVGDIANGPAAVDALARSGLRAVVFHEVFRLRASDAEAAMERAVVARDELRARVASAGGAGRVEVTFAPHAPHTTSPALIRSLCEHARASGGRWSVHGAESAAEVAWLRDGRGPLAAFYRRRGLDRAGWSPPGVSPVVALDRCGALAPGALVVHAVHVDDDDLAVLRARGVRVVVCPRSNAYLGVGRAPVPRLLDAGIPVALGTDSLASCDDLDPFAEMAALRSDHPGIAPEAILRSATLEGARALGVDDAFGSIERGRVASLVAVPLTAPGDDPYETVTSGPETVRPVRVPA